MHSLLAWVFHSHYSEYSNLPAAPDVETNDRDRRHEPEPAPRTELHTPRHRYVYLVGMLPKIRARVAVQHLQDQPYTMRHVCIMAFSRRQTVLLVSG